MAKTKPQRRKRTFPPTEPSTKSTPKPVASQSSQSGQRPMRWGLVILFLTISIGGTYLAIWLRPRDHAPRFTFEVLDTYPHDPKAFTQGLVYEDGMIWESTGRYGESTVRQTNLKTGEEVQRHALDDEHFGEGMTLFNDQLIQLTWKSGKALVYDRNLKPIKQLEYDGEGWGLATNGTDLIFSNGTTIIKFLDPDDFSTRRSIRVKRRSGRPVGQLNELEYFGGMIYANKYMSDLIYEIDPESGLVTKIIDLSGLWPSSERPADGLLNGIAINTDTDHFLVTGKLSSKIWELRLFKADE